MAGNEMLCYKEGQSLLLKCFINVLGCIRKVRGSSNSIYTILIAHIVLFSLRSTIQLHTKHKIRGSISTTTKKKWEEMIL